LVLPEGEVSTSHRLVLTIAFSMFAMLVTLTRCLLRLAGGGSYGEYLAFIDDSMVAMLALLMFTLYGLERDQRRVQDAGDGSRRAH
jgi:hypothetical protein